jgi:signal transduction histidine kinase
MTEAVQIQPDTATFTDSAPPLPPQPEAKEKLEIPHVRLVVSKDAPEDVCEQVELANLRIRAIEAVVGFANRLPKLPVGKLSEGKLQAWKTSAATIIEWSDADKLLSGVASGTTEDLPNSRDKVRAARTKAENSIVSLNNNLTAPEPNGMSTTDVPINTAEELTVALEKVRLAGHDVRNPIGAYGMGCDMYSKYGDPAFIEIANNSLDAAGPAAIVTLDAVADKYERNPLSLGRIAQIVKVDLDQLTAQGFIVNVSLDKESGPNQVTWSEAQLRDLLANINQNAGKAWEAKRESGAKDPFRLNAKIGTSNGSAVVVIEDNGPGFPQPTVDNGFQSGVTSWQGSTEKGTGAGMAGRVKAIEQYGGSIVPSNITDATERVVGARQTITLPLSPNPA